MRDREAEEENSARRASAEM